MKVRFAANSKIDTIKLEKFDAISLDVFHRDDEGEDMYEDPSDVPLSSTGPPTPRRTSAPSYGLQPLKARPRPHSHIDGGTSLGPSPPSATEKDRAPLTPPPTRRLSQQEKFPSFGPRPKSPRVSFPCFTKRVW